MSKLEVVTVMFTLNGIFLDIFPFQVRHAIEILKRKYFMFQRLFGTNDFRLFLEKQFGPGPFWKSRYAIYTLIFSNLRIQVVDPMSSCINRHKKKIYR